MSDFNPIAWTEGMFLRPQHMQQQERNLHFASSKTNRLIAPLSWGVNAIEIDHNLLALGQFRLDSIECIFRDNTLAVLPQNDPLPEPISVVSGTIGQTVFLVLPVEKSTGLNVSSKEDNKVTRYTFCDHNIVDTSAGSDAMEILQVSKLNCQLKLESDDRTGYVSIPIARIVDVSDEGAIRLDKKFIPPCISIANNTNLLNVISETSGMINQRAEAIAHRVSQQQGSSSSIADFLMLQLLNRYQLLFEHLGRASGIHPERLYCALLEFSGELSTFSSVDKRPPKLPAYVHDNLTYVISDCMVFINQGLSNVLEQTATQLILDKSRYGIYVAAVNDKGLFERADFILAIKANVPNEDIRTRLPAQIKVGSVESIRELVNNQLSGVSVTSLPAAPRQVPYHSGYHYFQLDKRSTHWKKLLTSGGIAMHFSGNYPELTVELWAINN